MIQHPSREQPAQQIYAISCFSMWLDVISYLLPMATKLYVFILARAKRMALSLEIFFFQFSCQFQL